MCLYVCVKVSTFNELVDMSGETPEDDSYKALTALGIVVALQSLVKATFNQPEVYFLFYTYPLSISICVLNFFI